MTNFDRLRQWLVRLREWQRIRNTRLRRIIMAIAIALLIGGIILSLRQQPDILSHLDWRPALVVVLIAVPITAGLNAVEFLLSGRMIGVKVSMVRSLEVTILGTAANMLPLPGSTLVRVAGLTTAGAGVRASSASTFITAAIWLGVAFAFAGGAIYFVGVHVLGVTFLAGGVFVWTVSMFAGGRLSGGLPVMLGVTGVKLALVVTDTVRIYLCLQALNVDASLLQAASFTFAGIAGSAVSIVPAGLGVREAVSAAMAPVVGLAVADGFLSSALNRLFGLVTMLPVSMVLAVAKRRYDPSNPDRASIL